MRVGSILFSSLLSLASVAMIGSPAFARESGRWTAAREHHPPPVPAAAPRVRPHAIGEAYASTLWPKVNGVATVYYVIDSASASSASANIATAIATFNADFPGVIHWVKWTNPATQGPYYVDINLMASDTSGQCEALEGYEAVAAQRMWGSSTCTVGTILHEMGHVIGLWHEQSRPDSATYVKINYANVIKGSWGYFQPPPDNYQTLASYDYASLMEYPPFAFSSNGAPVIESIPAGIPLGGSEGIPVRAKADYSAGDKDGIRRLYGAAPTNVTVTSNPIGLKVTVDGSAVVTPKTYTWALGSTHHLGVGAGVQKLKGDIANSTTATTFYYTYARWSDSTVRDHAIVVKPGNGEPAFPVTSPQITTYAANFSQLVPYSAVAYPSGSGQVTVAPTPAAYSGASGQFFTARLPVTLTASPQSPYSFYEFNNAPFWLPGGLGANPKSFYVPDTGNPVATTAEFAATPVYSVSLTPDYPTSNLYVYVDGGFAYTPKNFSQAYDPTWTPGSMHTIEFDSPEYPYSVNSRFAFVTWNAPPQPARVAPRPYGGPHGGVALPRLRAPAAGRSPALVAAAAPAALTVPVARSRANAVRTNGAFTETVTLPSGAAAYGATVLPEFAPATNFNAPPCGGSGTVSPPSPTQDGFYPSGQELQFGATAAGGWSFAGWSGDLSGNANPATLTVSGEILALASFNIVPAPLTLTGLKPASVAAGSAPFTLLLTGSGFARRSLVTFNGTYRAVTYVSSTQLKIAVTAADVATPAAVQVAVENYPSGWNGCAVFGYAPFFVS
jgi:hypothetical protein